MYALVTKGLNTFFFRFVCKEKYMEQDAVEYIYVLINTFSLTYYDLKRNKLRKRCYNLNR